MPYEIGLYQNDSLLFSIDPQFCQSIQETVKIFAILDPKFPAAEGYDITVFRSPGSELQVKRMPFRTAVESWPPTTIQELFFNIKEYEYFIKHKQVLTLEDAITKKGLRDLKYHLEVVAVHFYLPDFYLIETKYGKKYTLPGTPNLHGEELEIMEKEIFMDWLLAGKPAHQID